MALAGAEATAREWGAQAIEPEHILLALHRDERGLASLILVASKAPAAKIEEAVGRRVSRGSGSPRKLAFSAAGDSAVSRAGQASLELGHTWIGTEHILLGLARTEGVASDVLAEFGLTSEVLAVKIEASLAELAPNP